MAYPERALAFARADWLNTPPPEEKTDQPNVTDRWTTTSLKAKAGARSDAQVGTGAPQERHNDLPLL